MKLASFEKTDGQAGEEAGVRIYRLMFKGTVEVAGAVVRFTIGDRVRAMAVGADRIEVNRNPPPRSAWDRSFDTSEQVLKGDRLELEGVVSFEQRESGWVPTRIGFKVSRKEQEARYEYILLKFTQATFEEVNNRAYEIRDKLQGGAKFADLAKEQSDDPESAKKGGIVGPVPRSKITPRNLEGDVMTATIGELEIISTRGAVHVFRVLERR